MTVSQIPSPRVPFVDQSTGNISREWYRYLQITDTVTNTGTEFLSHVDESREQVSPDNNTWHLICLGTFNIILPLYYERSNVLTITNVGTGVITVYPSGSDLIAGKASLAISSQWSTAQLCPYSGGYVII